MLNKKKIKLLSIQPSSFYVNGGAARLLRRLYANKEEEVLGVYIVETYYPEIADSNRGLLKEIAIPLSPLRRPWMRWKLRNIMSYLQNGMFTRSNFKKITGVISNYDFDILHIINHTSYCNVFKVNTNLIDEKFKLWVSFHDYYELAGVSKSDTLELWNRADRRLVISKEIGDLYCEEFNEKPYEIITDGLDKHEISEPKKINSNQFIVYFSGLLHIEYYSAFKSFAKALNQITQKANVKFIFRGTQELDFLNNYTFDVEYRTKFISDKEIKEEMDSADLLYFPLKFDNQLFSKYSLSTKMVSYLGASGAIFFHGPPDSAAGNLLQAHNSAECCYSLEESTVKKSLLSCIENSSEISKQAKKLAKSQFDLEKIQHRFWH